MRLRTVNGAATLLALSMAAAAVQAGCAHSPDPEQSTPAVSSSTPPASNNLRTSIPPLLTNWTVRTAGANASTEDARRIATARRSQLPIRDPFMPLVALTCEEHAARGERVVWEDASAMALVDIYNRGPKLLVVPKTQANFPIDLNSDQLDQLSRVAAATCDALLTASGVRPGDANSCNIYINAPNGLAVRQLHVHVEASSTVSAPVSDDFLKQVAAQMRDLLSGSGCF